MPVHEVQLLNDKKISLELHVRGDPRLMVFEGRILRISYDEVTWICPYVL